MNDFKKVSEALQAGMEPKDICAMCPWDRLCVEPPAMLSADLQKETDQAKRLDEEQRAKATAEGRPAPLALGSLFAALVFAGKDIDAPVCPVFSVRLRSSEGRNLADLIRSTMKGWDDNRVGVLQ